MLVEASGDAAATAVRSASLAGLISGEAGALDADAKAASNVVPAF
jgi:hypothetical protein